MKEITAVFPFKTKSISVTGNRCSFNCSHCGRKYLHSMESITDTIKLGKRDFTEVNVTTETNNYKALKLYRRAGFREDYCYPQAYLLQKK